MDETPPAYNVVLNEPIKTIAQLTILSKIKVYFQNLKSHTQSSKVFWRFTWLSLLHHLTYTTFKT